MLLKMGFQVFEVWLNYFRAFYLYVFFLVGDAEEGVLVEFYGCGKYVAFLT